MHTMDTQYVLLPAGNTKDSNGLSHQDQRTLGYCPP